MMGSLDFLRTMLKAIETDEPRVYVQAMRGFAACEHARLDFKRMALESGRSYEDTEGEERKRLLVLIDEKFRARQKERQV